MADLFFKPNLDFGTSIGPIKTPGDDIQARWVRKWFAQPENSTPLDPGGYWGWVWIRDPDPNDGDQGGGIGGDDGTGGLGSGGFSGGGRDPDYITPVRFRLPNFPVRPCPNFVQKNGVFTCTERERELIKLAHAEITRRANWEKLLMFTNPNLTDCIDKQWCKLDFDCTDDERGLFGPYGYIEPLMPESYMSTSPLSHTLAHTLKFSHGEFSWGTATRVQQVAAILLADLILSCGGTAIDAYMITSYVLGLCWRDSDKNSILEQMQVVDEITHNALGEKIYNGKWIWWNTKTGASGQLGSNKMLRLPPECTKYFKVK